MKRLLIGYCAMFLTATAALAGCFPAVAGRSAPGVDYPQEGRSGRHPWFQLPALLEVEGALWVADLYGMHQIIQEGGAWVQGVFKPLDGELVRSAATGSFVWAEFREAATLLYRVEGTELIPAGSFAWMDATDIHANSEYVCGISRGYEFPVGQVFRWTGQTLEAVGFTQFDFWGVDIEAFGLGPGNHLYYKLSGASITGGVFAHDILELVPSAERSELFVPLEGESGIVWQAKVMGPYLYAQSYHEKTDEQRLSIHDLSQDPLHPTLVGEIRWNSEGFWRFVLSRDATSALLHAPGCYAMADLSDPSLPLLGAILTAQEQELSTLRRASGVVLTEQDVHILYPSLTSAPGHSMFTYFRGPGLDDPLTKVGAIDFPLFAPADEKHMEGDQLIEFFRQGPAFKRYSVVPSAGGLSLEWLDSLPVPDDALACLQDANPYAMHSAQAHGTMILQANADLATFNDQGETGCVAMPWTASLPVLQTSEGLLALTRPGQGLLVFDVHDASSPALVGRLDHEALKSAYLLTPPYCLVQATYGLYQERTVLEVWDLSLSPPQKTDEVATEGKWVSFWVYGKEWVYHEKQLSLTNRVMEILHLDSEGRLHPAGVSLDNFFSGMIAGTSQAIAPFYGRYYVYDLRDPGRPRISDVRSFSGRITDAAIGASLIFESAKGYTLLDPCSDPGPQELPFGWLDSPAHGQTVSGETLAIYGWAWDADGDGIASVSVYLDGAKKGDALIGQPRPDVAQARPGWPGIENSGFWASIDLSDLAPGLHRVQVIAWNSQPYDGATIGIADFRILE